MSKECCNNCKYGLMLEKLDYSKGGCTHTKMEGFTCMAFASEGLVYWMVGVDSETGVCECFRWRDQ